MLSASSPALDLAAFSECLLLEPPRATLGLGESPTSAGLHLITDHTAADDDADGDADGTYPEVDNADGVPADGSAAGAAALVVAPKRHERLATLGAAGAHLILAADATGAAAGAPSHPMVPTLNVQIEMDPTPTPLEPGAPPQTARDKSARGSRGCDLLLARARAEDWAQMLMARLAETASGEYVPEALRQGNVDFGICRGGAVSL